MFDTIAAPLSLPAWAVVLLPVALGVVIGSIRRHRDPKLSIDCDAGVSDLLRSLAGLTHGAAHAGNRVELFENGGFFDVMIEGTAAAPRWARCRDNVLHVFNEVL